MDLTKAVTLWAAIAILQDTDPELAYELRLQWQEMRASDDMAAGAAVIAEALFDAGVLDLVTALEITTP